MAGSAPNWPYGYTPSVADWQNAFSGKQDWSETLQDIANGATNYTVILGSLSGTANAIVATPTPSLVSVTDNTLFLITPIATNTGAMTLEIQLQVGSFTGPILNAGSACVGGEAVKDVPMLLQGTGTAFNIVNSGATLNVLNLSQFGASPSASGTINAAALATAGTILTTMGGGKLVIPPGTYIVGSQTLAGATGKGYAWLMTNLFNVSNCTKPVVVEGYGAILKIAPSLHYGAFDPVTGLPYASTPPFTNPDYAAGLGTMLEFDSCTNVVVKGIEIDGNITNQTIGGPWGDTGIQLTALGLVFSSCSSVTCEDVYTHDNGLDGVEVKYPSLASSAADIYPHTLSNVRSLYNGRQGLSWTGGNSLTCINCDFSHTGKNGSVGSSPGSGVDIEPDAGSLCENGTFINTRFYNNLGPGVNGANGSSPFVSFYNCTLIGTTQYSLWGQENWRFYDCLIVGAAIYLGGNASAHINASQYYGCRFYMDPAYSPNGTIYLTRSDFTSADNCLFEGCEFTAASGYTLPDSLTSEPVKYSNCVFYQAGSGTFYISGILTGLCYVDYPLGTWDKSQATFQGEVVENGTIQSSVTVTMTCGTSGTITLDSAGNTLSVARTGTQVVVSGLLSVNSVSSPVGSLTINGIPKAAGNYYAVSLRLNDLTGTPSGMFQGYVGANTTTIGIEHFSAGAIGDAAAYIQAGSSMIVSAVYQYVP